MITCKRIIEIVFFPYQALRVMCFVHFINIFAFLVIFHSISLPRRPLRYAQILSLLELFVVGFSSHALVPTMKTTSRSGRVDFLIHSKTSTCLKNACTSDRRRDRITHVPSPPHRLFCVYFHQLLLFLGLKHFLFSGERFCFFIFILGCLVQCSALVDSPTHRNYRLCMIVIQKQGRRKGVENES